MNVRRATSIVLLSSLAFANTGCGKVTEFVAERFIERSAKAKGVDLKLDLKGNSSLKGNGVDVRVGNDVALPSGWPSDIPVYPGGKVISAAVMQGNPAVTFTVTDSLDKVRAFYRDKFRSWTLASETASQGESAFVFRTGRDRWVHVSFSERNRERDVSIYGFTRESPKAPAR